MRGQNSIPDGAFILEFGDTAQLHNSTIAGELELTFQDVPQRAKKTFQARGKPTPSGRLVADKVLAHNTLPKIKSVEARLIPAQSADTLPRVETLADAIMSHFDAEYYCREYPDMRGDHTELVLHFIKTGWYEGRNPNAFFDTVSYLLDNQDVANSGINPFFHYLTNGRPEGRKIMPGVSPSVRTQLLFGYELTDWVERLRNLVDVDFYEHQLGGDKLAGANLIAHFAYRGWREGKSPNGGFNVQQWLDKYPTTVRYLVNPLLIQLEAERRSFDLSALIASNEIVTQPVETPTQIEQTADSVDVTAKDITAEQQQLSIVQSEFSPSYYLATYPDVAKAGVDPQTHFFYTGWREGRCPNQDFDTKYYLEVNEDIRSAGINPFWHYLVSGRAEGRLPRRPGGYRREIIDAAVEPSSVVYECNSDPNERTLTPKQFARLVKTSSKTSRGLVISLSHDCYVRQIGGTQIFIADEQRRFNDLDHTYIHLSPRISRLALVENNEHEFLVRVVIDGNVVGLMKFALLIDSVTRHSRELGLPSLFVVHCLLGFHVPDVIKLSSALRPKRSFYWLHDYSSICAGFNLLRNNVEFCGAPSPQSLSCRVCVYGKSRPTHLREMTKLFEACDFEVVSPSTSTLEIWRRSTALSRRQEFVHPHWDLSRKQHKAKPSRTSGAIRVAFLGFPAAHKGWPIFKELFRRFGGDSRYEFYHFAAKDTATLPGIKFVTTEVTAKERDAAERLLDKHDIDILLLLSNWPETFSFVAHEAISAGARILCLANSGNVAELIKRLGCGEVFETVDELIDYFASMPVGDNSSMRGRFKYTIQNIGTSATITDVAATAGQARER